MFTPSCSATSFWRNPSCRRRRLICSPKEASSLKHGSFLIVFIDQLKFGKKATCVCRCRNESLSEIACKRGPRCAIDYQACISGPMMDRIDLQIDVPAVSAADLALPPPASPRRWRSLECGNHNGHGRTRGRPRRGPPRPPRPKPLKR
ncbi:MAG: ATP-binding protein [Euryhalocaulis sp.]|nr:ATP-binding protein [Euryhalocaulis sp.]MBA4801353.1 ATP-binding protein [Euryhalocaulis sp.]